jgi:two-component system nitrate/nitrite response regulator NarL
MAVSLQEPQTTPFAPVSGAIVSAKNLQSNVITVVVADDHALFREALRELLEDQDDLQVVGEAKDGREAIDLARTLRPSVLLLNLHMPVMGGLAALAELSRLQPAVNTLIVASSASDEEVVQALQRGARGVVMKQSATELLFKSIRMVVAGQYWVGRECVGGLIQMIQGRAASSPMDGRDASFGLTPRELELVAAVVDGCANNDIAAQLKISAKTVKHHLTKIYSKVGVSNRLELALFAIQHQFSEGRFSETRRA